LEQTKCQKCRPITGIHAQGYDTRQLWVIDDAQLMTENVIDDALLQAMLHINYTNSILWRYEILSGILTATFLMKYCSLLGSHLDC